MEIMLTNTLTGAVIILLIMAVYVVGLLFTAFLSTKIPFGKGTIADEWTKNSTIRFALSIWPITWILYMIYYLIHHLTYHPIRYGTAIVHNGLQKRSTRKKNEEEKI